MTEHEKRSLQYRLARRFDSDPRRIMEIIREEIKKSPLTEEPPKGKWMRDGVGMFKCSECGRRICTSVSEDNPHNDFPFCHCGADMRGE